MHIRSGVYQLSSGCKLDLTCINCQAHISGQRNKRKYLWKEFFKEDLKELTEEAWQTEMSHHLCWPQRHCFMSLVLASVPLATPRAHSTSQPCPQRSTGDIRSLVGCHPQETLHCCRVTLMVFSSACSDLTYAGHHLLCPLLTTVLAKTC